MVALLIWLVCTAAVLYLVLYVFFPLARGAIYDPSTHQQSALMVDLAEVGPG